MSATAGYSGTPLPVKLGIRAGSKVALVDAPDGWAASTLGVLPAGAVLKDLRARDLDVIVVFNRSAAALRRRLPTAVGRLAVDGGLWLGWLKKASRIPTDLTEATVRRMGLATGLVDNKIAALDEAWSGLRFVVRVEDRR